MKWAAWKKLHASCRSANDIDAMEIFALADNDWQGRCIPEKIKIDGDD
jgi:hypothetical protein